MHGPKFEVTPDVLYELARGLESARDSLSGALREGVDTSDAIFGDHALATRVSDFAKSWRWQVQHLSTLAGDIAYQLVQVAGSYTKLEADQLAAEGVRTSAGPGVGP